MARLNVNGKTHDIDVEPNMPLLWAIREHVGLTGTKYGCGIAQCGACTVHVDGQAAKACMLPVNSLAGSAITTIEGVGDTPVGKKVQDAWLEVDVAQCGYCQTGQIMAAAALIKSKPVLTDADIETYMSGNICRCGTYLRIRQAIHRAADIGAR